MKEQDARLPKEPSFENVHQEWLDFLVQGCSKYNDCKVCRFGRDTEGEICYWGWNMLDDKTLRFWEKGIKDTKNKELTEYKLPDVKKAVEEEMEIKCDACGITETVSLTDGFIDSRLKFIQDGLNFEVAHKCREGHYGTVRLPNGTSLGEYIREQKGE